MVLSSCSFILDQRTVTFVNGEEVTEAGFYYGKPPSFPEDTLDDGYAVEWRDENGALYTPESDFKDDITLYAHKVAISYPVTYDANGGALPDGNPTATTVEHSDFTLLPATRDGAIFDGWYDQNGSEITVIGAANRGCLLTAHWRLLDFSITYNAADGVFPQGVEPKSSYTVDDWSYLLPSPVKAGYDFLGWFTEGGDTPLSSLNGKSEALTLTAHWKVSRYGITYSLNGGASAAGAPSYYTMFDEANIPIPTRYGYVFDGWTDGGDSSVPVKNYVIPEGSSGAITLTAHWSASPVTLSIYYNGSLMSTVDTVFDGCCDLSGRITPPLGYETEYYLDELLTNRITEDITAYKISSVSPTIHLAFEPIVYSVELDYGNGIPEFYRQYTVEADAFTLPTPTLEGSEFLGWSLDGASSPVLSVTVAKGSTGNRLYVARWKQTEYKLSFETNGAAPITPLTFTFGETVYLPSAPQKANCVFGGWYYDADFTRKFTGGTMPSEDMCLYARWYTDQSFALTYSAYPGNAAISCSAASGLSYPDGSLFELKAPIYENGFAFEKWTVNGVTYDYCPSITVRIDGEALQAIAVYSEAEGYVFDRASASDLVFPANAADFALIGNGITLSDYSLSGANVTVKNSYLSSLELGTSIFTVKRGDSYGYIFIQITDSAAISALSLDFDSAFPCLKINCDTIPGYQYTYSVNGSSPKPYSPGTVAGVFSRASAISVTVTCVSTSESLTVTAPAIESEYGRFADSCFSYGGQTYDYIIDSKRELDIFIEYACLVVAVTEAQFDATEGMNAASLEFAIGHGYFEEFNSNKGAAYASAFANISIPYQPSYVTSSYGGTNRWARITVYSNGFNTEVTDHPKTVIEDTFGLLSESGDRSESFNAFPIEAMNKAQTVRTVYELEALPYGVRPVFADTAEGQLAKQLYEGAKDILRTYVSDTMTDREKVAAIYAWLALNVTYDDTLAAMANEPDVGKYRGFTAYGAIFDKLAVCDGFAGAFKLMCQIEGIECEETVGIGNGEGHAWNKYCIDGIWYGADTTWSRISNTYVTHQYLFMNEAALISSEHIERGAFDSVTDHVAHASGSYYEYFGAEATSAASLAEIISNAIDNGVKHIEFLNSTGEEILDLFKSNEIKALHLGSFTYANFTGTDIYMIALP